MKKKKYIVGKTRRLRSRGRRKVVSIALFSRSSARLSLSLSFGLLRTVVLEPSWKKQVKITSCEKTEAAALYRLFCSCNGRTGARFFALTYSLMPTGRCPYSFFFLVYVSTIPTLRVPFQSCLLFSGCSFSLPRPLHVLRQ